MNPTLLTIIIILSSIALLLLISFILGDLILKSNFKRMDLEKDSFLIPYEDVKDKYERSEFTFKSKKNTLKGYIYGLNNEKLLVYVHGMCPGHTGYLSDIISLVDRGYKVITYDFTGTGSSEGKRIYGLPQTKCDLIAFMNYIQTNDEYKDKKYCLYGHSMGGYATAVCINKSKNIDKVVSISGYNKPHEFMMTSVKKKMGLFASIIVSFPIYLASLIHYGFKYNESAIKNINSVNKDIFIIHGNNDEIVPLSSSIYSQKDKITNKNAKFLLMSDENHNTHNSVIASTECVKYQKERMDIYNEVLKNTNDPKQAYKSFIDGLDRFKYNSANEELMEKIDQFYQK